MYMHMYIVAFTGVIFIAVQFWNQYILNRQVDVILICTASLVG